jgi:ubiquinone/menaquinone biosynthesis C-methylase UbiE
MRRSSGYRPAGMGTTAVIPQHFDGNAMLTSILDALADDGHDVDKLSAEVLAPIDHLHTFGLPAMLRLAAAAGIAADDVVLDVGCGLGGPARTLATHFRCQLVGVDVRTSCCEAAVDLNRRTGLDDLIEIREGDAMALPCEDAEFTVAWTQHASMNIAHKAQMYAEMRRALVTGGRLAFFDVLAGRRQPAHLPLPWADDESESVLATPQETRRMVSAAGFAIRQWDDVTELAAEHVTALARPTEQPTRLGAHVVVPDMSERAAMLVRNVAESRVAFVQCVADAI